MENKLKKATKRIAAVGTASLMVASAAFGAGLGNYPSNFVDNNDKFVGKVVVGSGVGADDTTAANSIIEDLSAEFSGDQEKVRITYREDSEGGDSVSAVDPKETLNFGETLDSVDEDLDKDVSNLLEDGTLDNDDYNQELELMNGEFSYRIFDEVDGEDTAKAGLYYDANQEFVKYTLDMEDIPTVDSDGAKDLIGEEMSIMGNEFTVVEISEDSLTVIGGSNKVSLGEGEEQTVTVDGKSYDISIQSVGDNLDGGKVLMTVNGQSRSIDLYDTDEIAGVSIAVTDLVSSSRDSVKGYTEIVVGGQKVELNDGSTVKINDEDLDDVYDEYDVQVDFIDEGNNSFGGFEITYKVDENVVLSAGDSLKDVLFDSFVLSYDGLNDVEYSEFKITSDNDEVKFSGNMNTGNEIPSDFQLTTDNEVGGFDDLYLGTSRNRIYFKDSDLDIGPALVTDDVNDSIRYDVSGTDNNVLFNISNPTTDVKDNMIWEREDDDEFYLYQITGVDKDDLEIDFEDLIAEKKTNAVDLDDVGSSLDWLNSPISNNSVELNISLDDLGDSIMSLENELEMDFSNVEQFAFNSTAALVNLTFSYNLDNIDMDDNSNEQDEFMVQLARDATDIDDPIRLTISTNDFVSNDEVEEDSDLELYVDHYGTMVTVDEDDYDSITIEVPDKEVEGLVSIVFGEASSSTKTVDVDADAVEDKKAELEDEGYTIVGTETLEAVEVEFDVTGVTMDTDAEGMDDLIVVGGPAVNAVARELLGIDTYTIDQAGVDEGEGVVKYFEDRNSVLVYGYSKADTVAAVNKLNAGGLSGDEETVN